MTADTDAQANGVASFSIDLGLSTTDLYPLYPHPSANTSLTDTITHWFKLTLQCDGFADVVGDVDTFLGGSGCVINVTAVAGKSMPAEVLSYVNVLPAFLKIGHDTYQNVVVPLMKSPRWDPNNTGEWLYFLPHGLPLLNFLSVQFFHYPPRRLFELGSYLEDPVPYRWGQLLETAGVQASAVNQFQRFLDAAPIAAPDSEGAYIPIDAFKDYQRDMLTFFLRTAANVNPRGQPVTVPIVVFGIPAMNAFEHMWDVNLDILVPQIGHIVSGLTTPILGSTHPYHFYAQAQIDGAQGGYIGCGHMGRGCRLAEMLMRQDMITARWQGSMALNAGADPFETQFRATDWALDASMDAAACALTQHQGSLYYASKTDLNFSYKKDMTAAAALCAYNSNDPCQ